MWMQAIAIHAPEGWVMSGDRVTPGTECLWRVILRVADPPEMGSNIMLSGKFA